MSRYRKKDQIAVATLILSLFIVLGICLLASLVCFLLRSGIRIPEPLLQKALVESNLPQ
jgi:hypothetical protein